MAPRKKIPKNIQSLGRQSVWILYSKTGLGPEKDFWNPTYSDSWRSIDKGVEIIYLGMSHLLMFSLWNICDELHHVLLGRLRAQRQVGSRAAKYMMRVGKVGGNCMMQKRTWTTAWNLPNSPACFSISSIETNCSPNDISSISVPVSVVSVVVVAVVVVEDAVI